MPAQASLSALADQTKSAVFMDYISTQSGCKTKKSRFISGTFFKNLILKFS